MDYLRQTVDSEKLDGLFDLPNALRGRKVEVIIIPAFETSIREPKRGSAFGCLQKYANTSFIDKERGAWERAAIEKYANR
jgi:hypothetical protein